MKKIQSPTKDRQSKRTVTMNSLCEFWVKYRPCLVAIDGKEHEEDESSLGWISRMASMRTLEFIFGCPSDSYHEVLLSKDNMGKWIPTRVAEIYVDAEPDIITGNYVGSITTVVVHDITAVEVLVGAEFVILNVSGMCAMLNALLP
jgi:hypothetical protein